MVAEESIGDLSAFLIRLHYLKGYKKRRFSVVTVNSDEKRLQYQRKYGNECHGASMSGRFQQVDSSLDSFLNFIDDIPIILHRFELSQRTT